MPEANRRLKTQRNKTKKAGGQCVFEVKGGAGSKVQVVVLGEGKQTKGRPSKG